MQEFSLLNRLMNYYRIKTKLSIMKEEVIDIANMANRDVNYYSQLEKDKIIKKLDDLISEILITKNDIINNYVAL